MKKFITVIFMFILGLIQVNAEWLDFEKGLGETVEFKEVFKNSEILDYSIIIPGVSMEDKCENGNFKIFKLPGYNFIDKEEGLPKVPVISELIAIPNCENVTIEVTPLSHIEYNGYVIYPQEKNVNYDGMFVREFYEEWQSKYSSLDDYYPSYNYEVSYPAVRGQRMADLRLYPLQFFYDSNPENCQIRICTEYRVTFHFENASSG